VDENDGFYAGVWEEGEFVKGDLTGKGKITFSDGSFQTGNYKQFRLNGLGEWHFANGDSYKGEFDNGRYSGKGEYTWKEDGMRYEGRFEAGKRKGFGTLYLPDNYVLNGSWINDCVDGESEITMQPKDGTDPLSAKLVVENCEVTSSTLPTDQQSKIHPLVIRKIRN
jgi:hypothetical protein